MNITINNFYGEKNYEWGKFVELIDRFAEMESRMIEIICENEKELNRIRSGCLQEIKKSGRGMKVQKRKLNLYLVKAYI